MTRSRRNRDAKSAASSGSTSAAPDLAAPDSGEPTTLGARLTTILRLGLPALVTALAVAAPLTPTESAPQGSYVILQLLTLLGLSVWALGQLRDPQRRFIGRSTDLLLAVFLAWFTLSALRMAAAGQARTSINVTWTWLAGGALWMLTRQSIRSPRMQRALLAVQAALAVCIASYGFYQCTIVMPADRAAFRENPEAVLREAGVEAPEGSALRDQFRNRLESRERHEEPSGVRWSSNPPPTSNTGSK